MGDVKKLAAGAIVVLVGLALIYWQMRDPHTAVAQAPALPARVAPTAQAVAAVAAAHEAPRADGKIDPASDAFTYHYDEVIDQAMTAQAAKCYSGGLHRVHRNQKLKLSYTTTIKNGVVSVGDVKIVESTINDKALESCFAREAAKATWRDDALPDYVSKNETLVIRPERGMKKFTKENLDYQGDGKVGKLEDPAVNATASREQPAEQPAPEN